MFAVGFVDDFWFVILFKMKLLDGFLSFYTHEPNESKIDVGHSHSNYLYKAPKQQIEQEEKEE